MRFGADLFLEDVARYAHGLRLGLVTNHTGVDRHGQPTRRRLAAHPSARLVCLFSPEHGITGREDRENLEGGLDDETGLPVHSLYGATRAPTPEMLSGLDAIVYDIQDVGARFYTYITTLSLTMSAAGRHGVGIIVLDRPNPIGGEVVEGPVLETDLRSFVGAHEIPIRHGMTVGELALLFRDRFGVMCDLTVVPCSGWRRGMYYDATGLPWRGPSPNLRTVSQAVLYPGICLLECSNLSVGRGTESPFEVVGAPWADGNAITRAIARCGIPGVAVVPATFVPAEDSQYPYAGRTCRGVGLTVVDRGQFRAVPLGLALLVAFRDQCPELEVRYDALARLSGSRSLMDAYRAGAGTAKLLGIANAGVAEFQAERTQYLIYPSDA